MEDYFKLEGYHCQPNIYLNVHLMLTVMAAPSTGISTGNNWTDPFRNW